MTEGAERFSFYGMRAIVARVAVPWHAKPAQKSPLEHAFASSHVSALAAGDQAVGVTSSQMRQVVASARAPSA